MSSHHSSKAKSGTRHSSNSGASSSGSGETLWERLRGLYPNLPPYSETHIFFERHGPRCGPHAFNKQRLFDIFMRKLESDERRFRGLKDIAKTHKSTKPEEIKKELDRMKEENRKLRELLDEFRD